MAQVIESLSLKKKFEKNLVTDEKTLSKIKGGGKILVDCTIVDNNGVTWYC